MDSAGQLDSRCPLGRCGRVVAASDNNALAGGAASLALGGPWPGGSVSLLGQQDGCFLAALQVVGQGERAGEEMSDQLPLDKDSQIIQHLGFPPTSSLLPQRCSLLPEPCLEEGLPWVAQARTGQALKGKGFQKHQNSKEKGVGAVSSQHLLGASTLIPASSISVPPIVSLSL